MLPQSLRARLFLMTVGVAAGLLVLGVVGLNFAVRQSLRANADQLIESRVADAINTIDVSADGATTISGSDARENLSTGVWVFSGDELIDAPGASPALTAAVRTIAAEPEGFLTIDEPHARVLVLPLERSGARVGTIVGGVRLEPYEHSARSALVGSIAFGLATLAALALLTWWALGAALRPVSQMTGLAARWSDESPDERFDLGEPRDELTRLGATLDGLLDRVSAGVRRERRLSAEIAHELRTPVSRISAEAQLALAGAAPLATDTETALAAIRDETQRLTRTIDALVKTAEGQSSQTRGTSTVTDAVAEVLAGAQAATAAAGVEIDASQVSSDRIGADGAVVTQILRPIVENAVRYSRGHVEISARRDGSIIEVAVVDDGPGVAPYEADAIFQPGRRGTAAESSDGGGGLGLALARRLASGVDGRIMADPGAPGGRFIIQLPAG